MGNELDRERQISAFGSRQLGIVTTEQCASVGYSKRRIASKLASGSWVRLRRGVFRMGPGNVSQEQRALSVLLSLGSDAVLSHHTAAQRLGLDVPASPFIHVLVPHSSRPELIQGARIWRTRDLSPGDSFTRGALRFTRVGRTLVDLSGALDDAWLRAAFDSALRSRKRNLYWAKHILDRNGSGHPGAHRLRKLVNEYEIDGEIPDSALESFAMELGLAVGRKPHLHHCVSDRHGVMELDIAWPELRLGIELDGWRHRVADKYRKDRFWDRRLVLMGWQSVRFVYKDVQQFPRRFVDEITALSVYRQSCLSPVTATGP